MITCPFCSNGNIEGVDVCDQCGQPLNDLHLSDPKNNIEQALLTDRVDVLAPRSPVVVHAEMPVCEVLQLLVQKKIGCVLVVDKASRPVGIFSERDALLKLVPDIKANSAEPVHKFMTQNVETLQGDAKVVFAVQRMDVGGFRHVPIVAADGKVTGVISVRDILRYITNNTAAATS